jgi:hypothetical protein
MIYKILALVIMIGTSQIALNAQALKKEKGVSYNPNASNDTTKKSIKAAAVGKIGKANITINYHSPAVRKRIIWGGLVPYDDVWVTGAHNATNIVIDKPFILGDKKVPAGKYALFTIPGKDEWIIILNRNWEQHLAFDYNSKQDVVRLSVKPTKKDNTLERLQYYITDKGNNTGAIAVEWEQLRIEFGLRISS